MDIDKQEKIEQCASIAVLLEMALFYSPDFENDEHDEKLLMWVSKYLYDNGIRFHRDERVV